MSSEYINGINDAPKAIGPYSQAVRAGNILFLSGQIPLVPETMQLIGSGVEEQTEQVLKNIKAVLSNQGLSFSDVVKTTIFLANMSDFKTVNGIYEKNLGDAKPARSTVQVAALPLGALVEIEMTAVFSK